MYKSRARAGWIAVLLAMISLAPSVRAALLSTAPAIPNYAKAFFEQSQLDTARAQARLSLRRNSNNLDALFVEMEAASLEADSPAVLRAAVRMLAIPSAQHDDRVAIAAARVNELAANSREFAAVLPQLVALARRPHAQRALIRRALVKAAMDGLRGVSITEMTKAAGLLTDWRAAGPFGDYPNLDFNRAWPPQHDLLMGSASDGHPIELFHFADGFVRLPNYFDGNGVLYAMSQTHVAGGAYQLFLESGGTVEVFVDGDSVLRHDARFRVQPAMDAVSIRLRPGVHTVLVKFLASALPFRVSLASPDPGSLTHSSVAYAPESQYISASRKFWDGDYAGAIGALQQARDSRESAAVDWMLYRSWTRSEKSPPEAGALLHDVLRQNSEALIADYALAERDNRAGRTDDALQHLSLVLGRRAYFAPAEELMGEIAVRMHLPVRAAHAVEILLDIHPSCDVLRRAQHFFALQANYDRARQIDDQLSACGIDSLAYARSLSETGDHDQAAAAAARVLAHNPLDRDARRMQARELALAGKGAEAQKAIQELADLSPNSARYRRMSAAALTDPLTLLDDSSAARISDAQPFYEPYRRDGLAVVKEAADRHFSGGPALLLLDDQIARLWPDGSTSVYVHRVLRALDRGGVEKYGEVSLPAGAEILNLRTIRADGAVLEPELTPDKATISMPGLLPGDAIDEEYVLHSDHPGDLAFKHVFGSFHAPILASRYILLTPAGEREDVYTSGDVPSMQDSLASGIHVRVWEKNNIAQSVDEASSAYGDILPTVRAAPALERGWEDVRDGVRDFTVDAERIGPRVQSAVHGLHAANNDELARALYRLVTTSVRSTTDEFGLDTPTAEQTLAAHAGSRTAALLAMAHALGLDADLVLARNAGNVNAISGPSADLYERPLVRLRLRDFLGGTHDVVLDAETDGLPYGVLPPSIARGDSLLVTLPGEREDARVEAAILRLPANPATDQGIARADITVQPTGDAAVDITILFGAWRGTEMRETLADEDESQRPAFFEQIATRIFPDAENVTGSVRNQDRPDATLQVDLHCTIPELVDLSRGSAELAQLVPELGLERMVASAAPRRFPLYLATPFFETSTFRIHLPHGVTVMHPPADFQRDAEFGSYSVSFREIAPDVVEVKRAFNIPAQVVAPSQYSDFSRFATQIAGAERQKIELEVQADRVAAQAHSPNKGQ